MFEYNSENKAGNCFLAKLNPLSKFFWLFSFSLTIYMIKELLILFFIFIIILGFIPLIGLKTKELTRNVSFILQIQLITTALSVFSYDTLGADPLFYAIPLDWPILGGLLPIYRQGLYDCIRFPLIMSTFIITALVFVMTTDPKKLAASLNHQLKIPVRISQSLAIGMNLIPMIKSEMENIRIALIARGGIIFGGPKKKISIIKSMKSFFSYLTTSLINILRIVDSLSISLDKRGLGLYKIRTEEKVEWKKWDSFVIFISIVFPVLIILYNLRFFNIYIPSLYSIFEKTGIIYWVYNNQSIFLLFLFFICVYIIIFIVSRKKKLLKTQTNIVKDTEFTFLKNNVNKKKINKAINVLKEIDQKLNIPIIVDVNKKLLLNKD